MNPDMLLAHFDQISEAPDAIPRLRRFILDLAVRGNLLPQDPNDEPAEELLKKIGKEKQLLVKDGEIRKERLLDPIEKEEIPFSIPPEWKWARLGSIAVYIQRGKSPRYAVGDGHPVISQRCVQWDGLHLEWAKKIDSESLETYEPIRFLRDGDLLWNSTGTGTIGRIIRVNRPAEYLVCDSHVTVIRCPFASERFISVWLSSDYVYGTIEERATGATNQVELNAAMANDQVTPLPPLAEQHRIVAKVDELMALCDELEEARARQEKRRDRLVAATLHSLNNGMNGEDFHNTARFYFNHIPRLTTRPEHIQQLRQTILNLAVRGKLVPQDPDDELVRKVLDRFLEKQNKWRELQIAKVSGKNRKIKSGSSEKRHDEPIAPNVQNLPRLPVTWEWVCWESLLAFGNESFKRGPFGSSLTKSIFVSSGFKVYEQYCPINDDCSFARYYVTPQKYKELQGFAVKAKDFLISCSGVTLGRITQIPDEYEEGIINQALLRVRIENELISDSFFKMLFRSPYFQRQIFSNSTGMAIPNVKGVKELKAIPFPLPPLAEQHRIVAKVEKLMAICDELEAQLTNTSTTRSQLLESVIIQSLSS